MRVMSALIVLLLPASVWSQSQAPVAASGGARIDWVEAPFELPAGVRDSVRFGFVEVPRDHDAPAGETFRLAILSLPALGGAPADDPLVVIPGGPGSPLIAGQAVAYARSPRIALYRERRAVVLLEPRGHGLSDPAMCAELDGAQPIAEGSATAERILVRELAACRDRLLTAGVPPELLTAVQSARDLDVLRRALGVPALNLLGSSYGSVDDSLPRRGLAQLLLTPELAAGLPLLVHTLAERGLEPLAGMVPRFMRLVLEDDVSYATHLAFLCNDASRTIEKVSWLSTRCPVWVGASYGQATAAPLESDVPTLIFTGEFDPRTPPSYARFLAAGMRRAHYVEMPWTGHSRPPDCAIRITGDFLNDPERTPDASCMDSVPPVRFVTGLVRSRWVARLSATTSLRPAAVAGAAGAATLLLLTGVVGLPVRARQQRSRGAPGAHSMTTAVIWLGAIGAVFSIVTVVLALYAGARVHPLVPALGLPAGWGWVHWLPGVMLALGLAAFGGVALDRDGAPARSVLRWSALLGILLTMGAWSFLALG